MEYGVNILIKAVETATAPIRKVKESMAKITEPVAKLKSRLKQLGEDSGLTRLRDKIKGLHEPLKKSQEEAEKLAKRLLFLGGGSLTGSILAFKKLFLDVAVGQENLARNMRNVTGSADRAKAAMAAIQQQMKGLPVDVDDAAAAYMRLKSEGIEPTADWMKRLADVSGHTGKSVDEVAQVLVNMKNGSTGGLAEMLGGNVKQVGNYMVAEFTDATGKIRRMAVKQGQNLAQNAKAMQHLFKISTDAKGMTGGAERFGQSWDGMVERVKAAWGRFVKLFMDSGPFKVLKEQFQGILSSFDELEKSGGLQTLAENLATEFCEKIKLVRNAAEEVAEWFKNNFLPAFRQVKDFLGGWGGVFKAIAAIMAGPFIASMVSTVASIVSMGASLGGPLLSGITFAAKGLSLLGTALAGPLLTGLSLAKGAVIKFGIAMMTTPLGWIIAGIAAVAGAVYLIVKHWDKIKGWLQKIWTPVAAFFKDLWGKVKGIFTGAWEALTGYITGKIKGITDAFDKGFLQGMLEIFKAFNPATWIMDALDSLTQKLFGFSLKEAGANMVNSLWDGLKSVWDSVVSWLHKAWETLTGWLPDTIKKRMGIQVTAQATGQAQATGAPTGAGDAPRMATAHVPFQAQGAPTGAAAVMAGGAAAAPGRKKEETKVRTEVVITGENLPPGITVSAPKSQADKTRLDCGYMMAGAH